jgi:hypothetical protein
VLAEIPPETTAVVWERLPAEKYHQLGQWAIELLVNSDVVDDQLFDNGLSPIQRLLKAFKVPPPEFKKAIWASIPSLRRWSAATSLNAIH